MVDICFTEERLDEKEFNRLRIFEKAAMENYLARSMILRREQLANRVATTADRSVIIRVICKEYS